jgi:hypothetical protein
MTPHFTPPRLGNKSFAITSYVDWNPGDEGILVGAGTNSGGYTLFIEDGRLRFHFNYLQSRAYDLVGYAPLEPGKHALAFDFVNTGNNCGIGRLLVDGRPGSNAVEIASEPLFPVAGYFAVGVTVKARSIRIIRGRVTMSTTAFWTGSSTTSTDLKTISTACSTWRLN